MSRAQQITAWTFGFVVAIWAMAAVSFAIYQTFDDVTLITGSVVGALSAVLGIPAGAGALAAMVKRKKEATDAGAA